MHKAIKNLEQKRRQKVRHNKKYIDIVSCFKKERIDLIESCNLVGDCFNYNEVSSIDHFLFSKAVRSYVRSFSSPNKINSIYYCSDVLDYMEAKLTDYEDKRFLRRHFDKILFFISCLYYFRLINKKYRDKSTYIELSSRFLRSVIGQRHYPLVLEIVLQTGVVECDGRFIYNGPVGKGCEEKKKEGYKPGKCYGYRLNKRFWFSKWKSMPVHLKIKKNMVLLNTDEQKHIFKSMEHASLPDTAFEVIEESDKCQNAKEIQWKLVEKFNNGEFHSSVSKKSGRFFYNVSSFMKDVRQLIQIDGEDTVEVDISASQPLLLNTLYQKVTPESLKFKNLTENCDFYEEVRKGAGLDYMEKKEMKECLYRILFGPMRYNVNTKIVDWFKKEFPILWNRIEAIKRVHHSEVPILLQKKEAEVVIGKIVGECMRKNIPVLTVHDSFMVKKGDLEFIISTIKDQFEKLYNLKPKLKTVLDREKKLKEYWEGDSTYYAESDPDSYI